MFPGTSLPYRTDDQVARIVAVNGTHRPPDTLEPLMCGLRLTETSRHQMSPNVHSNAISRIISPGVCALL